MPSRNINECEVKKCLILIQVTLTLYFDGMNECESYDEKGMLNGVFEYFMVLQVKYVN